MTHTTTKILFVSALAGEQQVIQKQYKKYQSSFVEADFLVSGMGSEKTQRSLSKQLAENNYDFVINIGICGHNCTTPEKCIQVVRTYNRETKKELLAPLCFRHAVLKSIMQSDSIVYESGALEGELYVDMESFTFEDVCRSFHVPRIILKVPYDRVGEETQNFDIKKACRILEENIDMKRFLEQIQSFCKSHTFPEIPETYMRHYQLSHSEQQIFRQLYFRYTSCVDTDFGGFFTEYKNLQKKEFFKTLRDTTINL